MTVAPRLVARLADSLRTVLVAALAAVSVLPSAADAAAVSTRRTRTVLAVERVRDAVVHIGTDQFVQSRRRTLADEVHEQFFRELDEPRGDDDARQRPLGSGVIIDPAGFILTSYAVVARGARLTVRLEPGSEFVARVIGTDPDTDIAVLKIDAPGALPFGIMGTSADLMVGESAIAMGNPFGSTRTVAVGVVSATNRSVRSGGRAHYDLIQTDAGIDPGNAGGPLVNGDGEIFGVITALGISARVGFAVPIERAKQIALALIKKGDQRQAYLGFDLQTVNEDTARALGVPVRSGASIVALDPKSPAELSGLNVGDVITSVAGRPVGDAEALSYALRDLQVGQQAVLEVHRGTDARTVPVVAVEFPLERAEALFARKIGALVQELNGQDARRADMTDETAVAVKVVTRNGLAERAGLAPGDIIRAVNSLEVARLGDFRAAVARARRSGSAVLLIQRGFQLEQITFDFF
jgi:serine protease Do